jgi:ATP-binding cassette subfamily C (CFTR/MRP) protein 4
MVGGQLTAEKVFVTVTLYQAIRLSMTLFIPFAIQFGSETMVTINRLKVRLLLG